MNRLRSAGFWSDQRGISMLEGLIVFPLVLLMFAALVEFGFAVFQWNQTVKAMQLGARRAAVSDPLVTDMSPLVADYPSGQGGPPPSTPVTVSCGAGTTPCDAVQLDRLLTGSDGVCDPDYGTGLPGICDFDPKIHADNIFISYHRSGLGFVGRPKGPVVTITLETRDLRFDLPFLGALLGLNMIEIPAHPVSITSEDLSNCKTSPCP